jgi:hypothetical protein
MFQSSEQVQGKNIPGSPSSQNSETKDLVAARYKARRRMEIYKGFS